MKRIFRAACAFAGLLALAFGAEWIREMVNYYMRHPG